MSEPGEEAKAVCREAIRLGGLDAAIYETQIVALWAPLIQRALDEAAEREAWAILANLRFPYASRIDMVTWLEARIAARKKVLPRPSIDARPEGDDLDHEQICGH